jgi:hypothetical protein
VEGDNLMTSFSELFGGGGGSDFSVPYAGQVISLYSSTTYVPSFTGLVRVHAFGGGGSGARSSISMAGGGAAAGYSRIDISMDPLDSYAVVVGAGGAQQSAGDPIAGNDGSATTFIGEGTSLTANGGTGGSITATPSVGGTASGGDYNITGGSGAAIAPTNVAFGGGAVGLLGVGFSANNAGFGGAGIGGTNNGTSGGGSGSTGSPLIGSVSGVFDVSRILQSFGTGGRRNLNTNMYNSAGPGAGGAGSGTASTPPDAGIFAGGGGMYSGTSGYGGVGGAGGGGGGGGEQWGGAGGDGLILIELLRI